MENVFRDYYFRIQLEVTISDLAALKQSKDKPAHEKNCSRKNNKGGTLPKAHITKPHLPQYI
ncbi:unnamed protein product [Prunus armeniaca]